MKSLLVSQIIKSVITFDKIENTKENGLKFRSSFNDNSVYRRKYVNLMAALKSFHADNVRC